ncbi:MAG: hypothetical protein DRI65_17840 [Chloroflexota bacterium]|nr:MAG: hypothetical protein DRI65_17840 [Chloroflexota bacterium]
MAGKFETSTGKDDKHYFVLKAGNGEVILQSQGYGSSSSCAGGIDSVRRNSQTPERFEKKTATNGKFYFVLTATNGQTVGKSQMYKTESGCDNGMKSVATNAADASLTEA